MAKGAIAATQTASELVAADEFRAEVILQHTSGSPIYLSFGTETPVVGEGIVLSSEFPVAVIRGARAMQEINGICDTGNTAAGSYTTDAYAEILAGGGGGGGGGGCTPSFSEKVATTARVDGASVNGVAMAASSTPYRKATVTARKLTSGATSASIANTDTVWICSAAEDMTGAFPLEPGQSMSLPDNCDLEDFFVAANVINEGVAIVYTVAD